MYLINKNLQLIPNKDLKVYKELNLKEIPMSKKLIH